MRISLLIQGSPYGTTACQSAIAFAKAVYEQGHSLYRVFFYKEGVYIGNGEFQTPSDESNIQREWVEFGRTHGLQLNLCVAATQRRGFDASTDDPSNTSQVFEYVGLGQFTEAMLESDRVVTFR